jgi:ATP-dependent Zn protease
VDETEARVKEILTRRDSDLKAISRRLLEKEVLEGDELRLLLRENVAAAQESGAR